MILVLTSLVVQGPRLAEDVAPLLQSAGLESCSELPAEFDVEFYIAGKLDRVHVKSVAHLEPELGACVQERLEGLHFAPLETHAKARVSVHVVISEEPVDRP